MGERVVGGGRRVRRRVGAVLAVLLVGSLVPNSPLAPDVVSADPPPDPPVSLSYEDEVLADGPLSWFRLDDAEPGPLSDAMLFDVTAQSGPDAVLGEGRLVDDGGSSLRAGPGVGMSSAGLGLPAGDAPRSIEAWVELPCGATGCLSEAGAEFAGAAPTPLGWPLFSYGDGFGVYATADGQFNVGWGSGVGQSAAVFPPGAETGDRIEPTGVRAHLVLSFDGTTAALWWDGQLRWSAAVTLDTVVPGAGLVAGLAGGRLDHLAVYDVALEPSRVMAHWVAGLAPESDTCLPAATDAYGQSVMASNPLGFYRFNDVTSQGIGWDESGWCRNARIGAGSGPATGVDGRGLRSGSTLLGSTASLGSGAGGNVPALPAGTQTRTYETWFRTIDTDPAMVLLSPEQFGVGVGGDHILLVPNLGSGEPPLTGVWTPEVSLVDGDWHLVHFVWDEATSTARVYIDGTEVWSATGALSIPPTGQPPGFGTGSGYFDDAAVYATALDSATISQRYAARTAPQVATDCEGPGASDRYSDLVIDDGAVRYHRLGDLGSDPETVVGADWTDGCGDALLSAATVTTDGALNETVDDAMVGMAGTVMRSPAAGLPSGTAARTLEAWVRPGPHGRFGGDTPTETWLIDAGGGFGFATVPPSDGQSWSPVGSLRFRWGPGPTDAVDVPVSAAAGDGGTGWTHIAATYAAGDAAVLVNGNLVWSGPATVDTAPGALTVGGPTLAVMGVVDPYGVDEVAVYDQALSRDTLRLHRVFGASAATQACPPRPTDGHAQVVVDDEPSAFYRLGELDEDPTGTVAFDVVGCEHGTYGASTEWSAPEALPGAPAGLDNTGARRVVNLGEVYSELPLVEVPLTNLPTGDQPRTIEFWSRSDPGGTMATGAFYGPEPLIMMTPDGDSMPVSPFQFELTNPDSWTHISITRAEGTDRLYLNGIETGTIPTPTWPAAAPEQFLSVIGGAIDELAIYPRALTASEVQHHAVTGPQTSSTTTLTTPDNSNWPEPTDPVEFTVEVTSPDGEPEGTVALYTSADNDPIATGELVDGTVTLTATLDPGEQDLHAVYVPTSTHVTSRSQPVTVQAPGRVATTTTVELDRQTSSYGQPVAATITVDSNDQSTPTGTVELIAGGTVRATGELDNGTATINISTLPPGLHELRARYTGDTSHNSSTSRPHWLSVDKAAPTLAASSHNDQLFRLDLTGPPGVAGPRRSAELYIDNTSVGTATVRSWFLPLGSTATITLDNPLEPGTYDLRWEYRGDNRYRAATEESRLVIPEEAPRIRVYEQHQDHYFGDVALVLVRVTNVEQAAGREVTLTAPGMAPVSALTDPGGYVWFELTGLPVGAHQITATVGTASATTDWTVFRVPTHTELIALPGTRSPLDYPDRRLVATVESQLTGRGVPSGIVEFYRRDVATGTEVSVGTAELIDGTAVLPLVTTEPGSYYLWARYLPAVDSLFAWSRSMGAAHQVVDGLIDLNAYIGLTVNGDTVAIQASPSDEWVGGDATLELSNDGGTTFMTPGPADTVGLTGEPASFDWSVEGLAPGDYLARVTYNGSTYAPSKTLGYRTFRVLYPASLEFEVSPAEPEYGEPVTITGAVTVDSPYNPAALPALDGFVFFSGVHGSDPFPAATAAGTFTWSGYAGNSVDGPISGNLVGSNWYRSTSSPSVEVAPWAPQFELDDRTLIETQPIRLRATLPDGHQFPWKQNWGTWPNALVPEFLRGTATMRVTPSADPDADPQIRTANGVGPGWDLREFLTFGSDPWRLPPGIYDFEFDWNGHTTTFGDIVVRPLEAAVTLESNRDGRVAGEPVTVTATVDHGGVPVAAEGWIDWYRLNPDGTRPSTPLHTSAIVATSDGRGTTAHTVELPTGPQRIAARYRYAHPSFWPIPDADAEIALDGGTEPLLAVDDEALVLAQGDDLVIAGTVEGSGPPAASPTGSVCLRVPHAVVPGAFTDRDCTTDLALDGSFSINSALHTYRGPGHHQFKVVYSGDVRHRRTVVDSPLIVVNAATSVRFDIHNPSWNHYYLAAEIDAGLASAVNGGEVTFTAVSGGQTIQLGRADVRNGGALLPLRPDPGTYQIHAEFSGYGGYLPSATLSPVELFVPHLSAFAELTAPEQLKFGETAVITGRIETTGPISPDAVVELRLDSSPWGVVATGTLAADGSFTISTRDLHLGSHPYRVVFPGSSDIRPRQSEPFVVAVERFEPSVAVTLPSTPVALSAMTFTATLSPPPQSEPPPAVAAFSGGTVTFFRGAEELGSAAVIGSTASVSVNSVRGGVHQIRARFNGSAHALSATSAEVDLTVSKATPTLSATVAKSVWNSDEPVRLSAHAQLLGVPFTSGTVEFLSDGAVVGSAELDGTGVARREVTLGHGVHDIVARVVGTADIAAVESSSVQVRVRYPTTVTVTAPAPITFGENANVSVSVTTTAAAGAVTGSVQLFTAGQAVGDPEELDQGTATLPLTRPGGGRHTYEVRYQPTALFDEARSDSFDLDVARRVLPVQLVVAPASVSFSTQLTLTATVSSVGSVKPSGFVSFYDGSTLIGVQQLSSRGQARLLSRSLEPGSHVITARLGSTSDLAPSESPAHTVTVTRAVPLFDIDAPSGVTTDVEAAITVSVAAPGGAPAAGTVELWRVVPGHAEHDEEIADAVLDDSGQATFSCGRVDPNEPPACWGSAVGLVNLQLRFPQTSTRFESRSSEPFQISVNAANQTTLSVSPPADVWAGARAQIEVTAATDLTGVVPAGRVVLTDDDGNVMDERPLQGGSTTLYSTPLNQPGTNRLKVRYLGDALTSPTAPTAIDVVVSERARIVADTPEPFVAGTSAELTLQLQRPDGDPLVAPAGGVPVEFFSTSFGASFSVNGGVGISEAVVAADSSSLAVRITNTSAGSHFLLVRAPSIGVVSWTRLAYTVTPGAAAALHIVPNRVRAAPGENSQTLRVMAEDEFGNSLGTVPNASLAAELGATCSSSRCSSPAAGEYEITAIHGQLSATAELFVNTAPTVNITGVTPDTTNERLLNFEIELGDNDGDPVDYLIDWGDGSATTEGNLAASAGVTTITAAHRYISSVNARMVVRVSDGNGPIVWRSHQVRAASTEPLVADAGDDRVVKVGDSVRFDAVNSTPQTAQLSYRWAFGDGTFSEWSPESAPAHVYTTPGNYTVTLWVRRGAVVSQASTASVLVTDASGSGVHFTVRHGTSSVAGASVVVTGADQRTYRGVESTAGNYAMVGLADGQHSAYVYRNGFEPTSVSFHVSGGVAQVPVQLRTGAAAEATLTTRRLTVEQAQAYGVDVSGTGASNVIEFRIDLPERAASLSVFRRPGSPSYDCIAGTDSDYFAVHNGQPAPETCELRFGDSSVFVSPAGDAITVMNKTRASWAKEVFEVSLEVFNISPGGFTLAAGEATLDLPDGLGLAEMALTSQDVTRGVPAIAAGSSQRVNWYLRGDVPGDYHLSADYTSVLDPVGDPIRVRAETDEDNLIKVWGVDALQLNVTVDATVRRGRPHRQVATVTNIADVAVHNVTVGLDTGAPGSRVSFLAQPRQRGVQVVGTIAPGASFTAPESRLLYPDNGRLPESFDVGTPAGPITAYLHHQANLADLATPTLQINPGGISTAGATLSWVPAPGATGYEVFTTPSYSTGFPAEPVPDLEIVTDPTTGNVSTQLPPSRLGYGLIAISALMPEGAGVRHEMVHPLVETDGQLPSTPHPNGLRAFDPCRGYGTDPTISYPGNFAHTELDAAVASLGPELEMRRTYNSMNPLDLGLGRGWTFGLAPYGRMDLAGNMALIMGDGRCIPAVRNTTNPLVYDVDSPGEQWSATVTETDPSTGEPRTVVATNHTTKRTYTIDSDGGVVVAVDNANRHRQAFSYYPPSDPDGPWEPRRLRTVTDVASGRSLHFDWDPSGTHIVAVRTDPEDAQDPSSALRWTYHYDQGHLVAVCDPRDNAAPDDGGSCRRYGHADDRLSEVIDAEGNSTTVGYDDEGRVNRTVDPTGAVTTRSYQRAGDKTVISTLDPRGTTTTATYSSDYRLIDATGPDGASSLTYNNQGHITGIRTPAETLTIAPNAAGVPTQVTSSRAGTFRFGVNSDNNVTASTDPRGAALNDPGYTTVTQYGPAQRPISRTTPSVPGAPDGLRTTWEYSGESEDPVDGVWPGTSPAIGGGVIPNGLVISETRPVPAGYAASAGTTTYGYDAAGNLVRTVEPGGRVTTATYDWLGRQTSITVGEGADAATTSYGYDPVGNRVRVTYPSVTNQVSYQSHRLEVRSTYDANNQVTRIESVDIAAGPADPDDSRVVTIERDELGREALRTTTVDAEQFSTTERRWDANGNETHVIDAEGTVTRRVFDRANRMTEVWIDNFTDPTNPAPPRPVRVSRLTYASDTGQLTSRTDAVGRITRYGYDANGRPNRTWLSNFDDGSGATKDYELSRVLSFDAAGNPLVELSANGTLRTERSYDAIGRPAAMITDPAGVARTVTFGYDAAGNQTARHLSGTISPDPLNPAATAVQTESTYTTYNAAGQVIASGPAGMQSSYGYDALGRRTSVTNARGHTTTTTYDLNNRVVAILGPAVAIDGDTNSTARPTTTWGYNAFGDRTHTKDPLGHVSTDNYNQAGWRVSRSSAPYTRPADDETLTATTEWVHDLNGRVVTVTGPDESATTTTRDALGRVVRTVRPGPDPNQPSITESAFDDSGRLIEQIRPSGLRITYGYDSLDRQVRSSEHVAGTNGRAAYTATTRTVYDDAGNPVRRTDPTGAVSRSGYNAVGELIWSISPQQHLAAVPTPVSYRYDVAGRQISSTDELGRISAADYDLAGRLVGEGRYDRDNSSWTWSQYGYDDAGNRTSAATGEGVALGYATSFVYDAADRLVAVSQPVDANPLNNIVTGYGYDLAGNVTLSIDGRGNETRRTYNSWGLEESLVEPSTSAHPSLGDRSFVTSYDVAGRVDVEELPGDTIVESFYDGAGNMVGQTGSSADSEVETAGREMSFDSAGRLVSIEGPVGDTLLSYDQRGQLVTQHVGESTSRWFHDPAGRLERREDQRGVASFAYNAAGLLDAMVDPVSGRRFVYGYHPDGRIASVTASTPGYDQVTAGGDRQVTSWGFDDLGRLTSTTVTGGDGALRYGELLGLDRDDRITSRTITTGTAGGSGGSAGSTVSLYGYDRAGRLVTAASGATTVGYGYDRSGNRTHAAGVVSSFDARNRLTGSSDGVTYRWGPSGELRERTDTNGSVVSRFDALGRLVTSGDTAYTWDSRNRLVTASDAERVDEFAYDGTSIDPVAVGDTERGTDADNATVSVAARVVTANSHRDLVTHTDTNGTVAVTGFDPFGVPAGSPGVFGYQSDYTDPATTQVWMGARWYDPNIAVFTSRDTWAGHHDTPVTLNRYAYANNDPINHWDPTGHWAEPTPRQRIEAFMRPGLGRNIAIGLYETHGLDGLAAMVNREAMVASTSAATVTRAAAWAPRAPRAARPAIPAAIAVEQARAGHQILQLLAAALALLAQKVVLPCDAFAAGVDVGGCRPGGSTEPDSDDRLVIGHNVGWSECEEYIRTHGNDNSDFANRCLEAFRDLDTSTTASNGNGNGNGNNDATNNSDNCPATNSQPDPTRVGVDTNALIRAIENGEIAALDAALAGRTPVISPQAAREFAEKGNQTELDEWMRERGAERGSEPSGECVDEVAQANEALGRTSPRYGKDIQVLASAIEDGVGVITRDAGLGRLAGALNWVVEVF